MTTVCPPDDALRSYAIGTLDDASSVEIERHLGDCPACEDTVARFESTQDSLMRHLPLAAAAEPAAHSRLPGWLERLRGGLPAERIPAVEIQEGNAPLASLAEFSSYELLGVLGRGGMGVVYRARHKQLNRSVALKVLNPRLMATAEARLRFEREIQIMGGLDHPGIVLATDAGRIQGGAYLVMELIDGIDLGRLVRQGGPLTIGLACEAARQMAEALDAAHRAGTVHRDVKPSNAMVDRQGRVKLLDFGLAHLAIPSMESLETPLGRLLGTLDYMAPEQADFEQPIDARADVFALGATLFYLLTGRGPRGKAGDRSLLDQLSALGTEAPRISTLRGDIPEALDDFVAKLLSPRPEDRPASAAAVAETLSTWAAGSLAALVAEIGSTQSESDKMSRDGEAARRSLTELLGADSVGGPSSEARAVSSIPQSHGAKHGIGRRLGTALAAAAVLGGTLFGVTILLETPKGTLRIESEVADVRIELVDEKDKTSELKINRGPQETTLRAGRYRVRLVGAADGISLDRNEITLTQGKETLARITQQETPGLAAVIEEQPKPVAGVVATETPARISITEPLYQGKTESEWLRLLKVETEPGSKLEAAGAILNLAMQLPAEAQIERILEVGTEIVRASNGEDALNFAFAIGLPYDAPRWRLTRGVPDSPYGRFNNFLREVNQQVHQLPADKLARALCDALLNGTDPRAAFSAWLLKSQTPNRILSDPTAVQIVLKKLDVPRSDFGRSAICLLLRVRYGKHASAEQKQRDLTSLGDLTEQLRSVAEGSFKERLRIQTLEVSKGFVGADAPLSLRTAIARLILASRTPNILNPFPVREGLSTTFHYGTEKEIDACRGLLKSFLDVWLVVANEYLEEHRGPPFSDETRNVIRSIDQVLRLYSDGDDWPVQKTVELLNDYLRHYYTEVPGQTVNVPANDLMPGSSALLLTQIVRVTGALPDFVRNGHPKPKAIDVLLKRFEDLLTGKVTLTRKENAHDALAGLLDAAPREVIRLAVTESKFPPVFGAEYHFHDLAPTDLIDVTSSHPVLRRTDVNTGVPPVDPLLLLPVLADLTGKNKNQDLLISTILSDANTEEPRSWVHDQLSRLLRSKLKAREHADRLLKQMRDSAVNDNLRDVIREIEPN